MQPIDLFTNLAFPVAVAAYLLLVVTKRLEELRNDHLRINAYLALLLTQIGMPEAAGRLLEGQDP